MLLTKLSLVNRESHKQEIAKHPKRNVDLDRVVKMETTVADESISRMDVEESYSVEKDIVPKNPVEEPAEKKISSDKEISADNVKIPETQPKTYKQMKEGLRLLVPKRLKEKKNKSSFWYSDKMAYVLFTIFIVIAYLWFRELYFRHTNMFADTKCKLKKQIYGQNRAVEAVGNYLRRIKPELKIVALVGGTGVGKSYAVQIIESDFPNHSVRWYYSPIRTTMNDVPTSYFFLYPKLIILENLRERNLPDVVNFLKKRDKVTKQFITVLAVFNVEHIAENMTRITDLGGSSRRIRNTFARENIAAKVISFEPLGEDTLEQCIIDAANYNGVVTLTYKDVESIREQLEENNTGCKGAYNKVQLAKFKK